MQVFTAQQGYFARNKLIWIWIAIITIVLLLVISLVLAALVGGAVMFHVVENPVFCGKVCHEKMTDSYESWKKSSHHGIACAHCHNEPGFQGFWEGTVVGAIHESDSYWFSEAWRHKPLPQEHYHPLPISGQSCMREECHKKERLEAKTIYFKGVPFRHQAHEQLICVNCHRYDFKEHMRLRTAICYTCHLSKSLKAVQGLADDNATCQSCHVPRLIDTEHFDHLRDIPKGKQCLHCHAELAASSSLVADAKLDQKRCSHCHDGQQMSLSKVVAKLDNQEKRRAFHAQHNFWRHRVPCESCHTQVHHRIDKKVIHSQSVAQHKLECATCHAQVTQRFKGLDRQGRDLEEASHLDNAECTDCHNPKHQMKPQEGNEESEEGCYTCHGGDATIKQTQEEFSKTLTKLTKLLAQAQEREKQAPAQARKALRDKLRAITATLNWLRADGSKGVHNMAAFRKVAQEVSKSLEAIIK